MSRQPLLNPVIDDDGEGDGYDSGGLTTITPPPTLSSGSVSRYDPRVQASESDGLLSDSSLGDGIVFATDSSPRRREDGDAVDSDTDTQPSYTTPIHSDSVVDVATESSTTTPTRRPGSRNKMRPLPRHPSRSSSRNRRSPKGSPRRLASKTTPKTTPKSTSKTTPKTTPTRKPFVPKSGDPMYNRMKYFNSLRNLKSTTTASPRSGRDSFLEPPSSILPSYLFGIKPGKDGKQSSWSTITSIINTMMGTTVVALPYGYCKSGIIAGIAINLLMGAIACYTCILILRHGKKFQEFSAYVQAYLGNKWQYAAWAMSVGVILGAAIVYHILMQQCLTGAVNTILYETKETHSWFGDHWNAMFSAAILLIMFPITNLKNMQILVRINSLGFIFLGYTIIFIIYHGIHSAASNSMSVNTFAPSTSAPSMDHNSLGLTIVARVSFGTVGGMAMLSFFIHNCIQPITRHADPEKRERDVILAFIGASLCYVVIGTLGYIGYADTAYPEKAFSSNFLQIFSQELGTFSGVYAFTARISLLCQLLTVYPLLLLIIRTQFFGVVYNTPWPSFPKVLTLNGVVMTITFLFAAFNVQVSNVVRFTGAFGGMLVIFYLPVAIDIKVLRRQGRFTWTKVLINGGVITVGAIFFVVQFIPMLS